MPEGPEIRIMSDYINHNCSDKIFDKSFNIEKGNIPKEFKIIERFRIKSESHGKELKLHLYNDTESHKISVFMGMSGNWKFTETKNWNDTKYCRLRLDTIGGLSLLLYGSYMGPKYKIGNFTGTKRGPDPVIEFDKFKNNILSNLDKSCFQKTICESLMNQEYFNGVGAYLNSEIIGRLDIDPFRKFTELSNDELNNLLNMIYKCSTESYNLGGGQLMDWENPYGESKIDQWILFYGNKNKCYKEKFGKRNIWIQKKFRRKNETD